MSKGRILDAVRRLDIEAVRTLLDEKPALADVRDRQDRNLLHIACSAPGAEAMRMATLLLDRGFDIEALSGRDRCTPLFFAVARARNPNLAKLLIDRCEAVECAGRRALRGGMVGRHEEPRSPAERRREDRRRRRHHTVLCRVGLEEVRRREVPRHSRRERERPGSEGPHRPAPRHREGVRPRASPLARPARRIGGDPGRERRIGETEGISKEGQATPQCANGATMIG